MKSRYDLMKQSGSKDNKGNNYPDPLTLDLKNVSFDNPLKKVTVTQRYVTRPYLLTYDEYGLCYFDDILYWLNGVSYTPELEPGEELLIPNLSDLKKFYSNNLVTSR